MLLMWKTLQRRHNRDYLAVINTNSCYRDVEIKGQFLLPKRNFTLHILFIVLYTVLI